MVILIDLNKKFCAVGTACEPSSSFHFYISSPFFFSCPSKYIALRVFCTMKQTMFNDKPPSYGNISYVCNEIGSEKWALHDRVLINFTLCVQNHYTNLRHPRYPTVPTINLPPILLVMVSSLSSYENNDWMNECLADPPLSLSVQCRI